MLPQAVSDIRRVLAASHHSGGNFRASTKTGDCRMTATITRPKPKKAAAAKPQSPYKRLHVIIPIEDMLWVRFVHSK